LHKKSLVTIASSRCYTSYIYIRIWKSNEMSIPPTKYKKSSRNFGLECIERNWEAEVKLQGNVLLLKKSPCWRERSYIQALIHSRSSSTIGGTVFQSFRHLRLEFLKRRPRARGSAKSAVFVTFRRGPILKKAAVPTPINYSNRAKALSTCGAHTLNSSGAYSRMTRAANGIKNKSTGPRAPRSQRAVNTRPEDTLRSRVKGIFGAWFWRCQVGFQVNEFGFRRANRVLRTISTPANAPIDPKY
jgi:hypothetical protein